MPFHWRLFPRHGGAQRQRRPARFRLTLVLCTLCASPAIAAADVPLADAAEKADWQRVRVILKEKPDAKVSQVDGMTALHWAAYHDEAEAAKALLAAGASATCANRYG